MFNLTKRQLLCFGGGGLIGVPLFFLIRSYGSSNVATICMIIVMLPAFLFAIYEKNGQLFKEFKVTLKHALQHTVSLGSDVFGNIQRIDNLLGGMESQLHVCETQLTNAKIQLENAKEEVEKPFLQEGELKEKSARLNKLNILLNMDKPENEILDGGQDENPAPVRASSEKER